MKLRSRILILLTIAFLLFAKIANGQKGISFLYDLNDGLARQASASSLCVINPDSGPGRAGWDGWKAWRKEVASLEGSKTRVAYYIDSELRPGDAGSNPGGKIRDKSSDEMLKEVALYIERYKATNPFVFIDDCKDIPSEEIKSFIRKAREIGISRIISNPGNPQCSGKWNEISDFVVVWETDNYPVKFKCDIPSIKQIHVAINWTKDPGVFIKASKDRCAYAAAFSSPDNFTNGQSCYTQRDPLAHKILNLLKK
jgi:hypothetical protein